MFEEPTQSADLEDDGDSGVIIADDAKTSVSNLQRRPSQLSLMRKALANQEEVEWTDDDKSTT